MRKVCYAMFLGTPSEFVGKTLLRVLRASVVHLFLSKSQHGDTEITESTRRDSIFPTDSDIIDSVGARAGTPFRVSGKTLLRVLRACSVVHLFLSKSQHGDTEIT